MNKDWLTVFEALRNVYSGGAYSNIAVNEAVSRHKGVRESFVRTFAKGVIRDSIRLDFIIDSLAERGIDGIKIRPLIILRMGIYAADCLDSVPEYAAVNEAVALAKSTAKGSDRFVNGMLRAYLRRRDEFCPQKLEPHIRYSFKEPVFSLLKNQYGDEALQIIEALNRPPELYLRVNALKTDRESLLKMLRDDGIRAEASDLNTEAVRAEGEGIVGNKLFRDGFYSVQSLSSMIAVKALDPKPGSRALDLCAAPGGKTGYMAELMQNRGSITACDIYPHRLALIEAAMKRTGVETVSLLQMDASAPDDGLKAGFDYVLADVPCSGLGVTGSKPEIKLSTDPSEYGELIEIQKRILFNAISYAKPGGRIMYSTCTLNRNENEGVVKHVLSNERSLGRIIEMTTILPYNGKVGFFYSIIEKNANQQDGVTVI